MTAADGAVDMVSISRAALPPLLVGSGSILVSLMLLIHIAGHLIVGGRAAAVDGFLVCIRVGLGGWRR